jgi:hypothetical protein
VKPYLENTHYKKRGAGGVAQDKGPEFKPQYHKKKKKKKAKDVLPHRPKKGLFQCELKQALGSAQVSKWPGRYPEY